MLLGHCLIDTHMVLICRGLVKIHLRHVVLAKKTKLLLPTYNVLHSVHTHTTTFERQRERKREGGRERLYASCTIEQNLASICVEIEEALEVCARHDLPVCQPACLPVCLSVCPRPSVCPSICPPVRPFARPSVRLSVCLSVCLSCREG